MFNLRLVVIMSFLLLTPVYWLSADLTVQVKGSTESSSLSSIQIGKAEYISIEDLRKLFKSIIKEERSQDRVFLMIYGDQFIFQIKSPYYTYRNKTYNMILPLLSVKGKYYISQQFVTEHLKKHFPDAIQSQKGKLIIKAPRDNSIKTIVIDPGHGGKDPGAVGRKYNGREKDINLAVSLKLKQILEKELGINVLLTREDDRFVSLQQRTKFANDNHADLFVSVHTNASKNTTSHGIEVYYLSTAKTTEARAVEALENSVVEIFEGGQNALKNYDDLSIILSDILQAENLEASNLLADRIIQNITNGTKGVNRGIRQANFFVLRGAFMPSILIECGFITNSNEEAYLLDSNYQDRLARTIFEGIKSFKYRYDRIRNA